MSIANVLENTFGRVNHEISGPGNRSYDPERVDGRWGAEQIKAALETKDIDPVSEIRATLEAGFSSEHINLMKYLAESAHINAELAILRQLYKDDEKRLGLINEFAKLIESGEFLPIWYGTSGTEFNSKEVVQTAAAVRTVGEKNVIGMYFIDPNSHPVNGGVELEARQAVWMLDTDESFNSLYAKFESFYLSAARGNETLGLTGDSIPAPTVEAAQELLKLLAYNQHTQAIFMMVTRALAGTEATLADWKIILQGVFLLDLEMEANEEAWNPTLTFSWNDLEDYSLEKIALRKGLSQITLVDYIAFFEEYYSLTGKPLRIWNMPDGIGGEIGVYASRAKDVTRIELKYAGQAAFFSCEFQGGLAANNLKEIDGDTRYKQEVINLLFQTNVSDIKGNHGGKGYYAHIMNIAAVSGGPSVAFFLDDYEAPDAYDPLLKRIKQEATHGLIPFPMGRTWVVPEKQKFFNGEYQDPDSTLGAALATIYMPGRISSEQWRKLTSRLEQPRPGETRVIGLNGTSEHPVVRVNNRFVGAADTREHSQTMGRFLDVVTEVLAENESVNIPSVILARLYSIFANIFATTPNGEAIGARLKEPLAQQIELADIIGVLPNLFARGAFEQQSDLFLPYAADVVIGVEGYQAYWESRLELMLGSLKVTLATIDSYVNSFQLTDDLASYLKELIRLSVYSFVYNVPMNRFRTAKQMEFISEETWEGLKDTLVEKRDELVYTLWPEELGLGRKPKKAFAKRIAALLNDELQQQRWFALLYGILSTDTI